MSTLVNSIYHLVALPVRDLWKRHNLILSLSSIKEFDEHQKLYVIMCVDGSFPIFPLNFGIFGGILGGMTNNEVLWEMWSFIRHDILGNYSSSRKGNDI
jgi:hypothetical protein